MLKVITIFVTSVVVLVGGALSKAAVFFILAQIQEPNKATRIRLCNRSGAEYFVDYGEEETVAWKW